MIRAAVAADAARIVSVYNYYIANTVVTFEEQSLGSDEMAGRILEVQAAGLPWLVAEDASGDIPGYAYASRWNGRCAYRFAVEITVYLAPGATSRGLGSQLYEALFAELRARSMHVVIGGIALPNETSVALHEKFGMEKVAHFSEVGFKFDRWVDVGYWQGILDGAAPERGRDETNETSPQRDSGESDEL